MRQDFEATREGMVDHWPKMEGEVAIPIMTDLEAIMSFTSPNDFQDSDRYICWLDAKDRKFAGWPKPRPATEIKTDTGPDCDYEFEFGNLPAPPAMQAMLDLVASRIAYRAMERMTRRVEAELLGAMMLDGEAAVSITDKTWKIIDPSIPAHLMSPERQLQGQQDRNPPAKQLAGPSGPPSGRKG